MNDQPQDPGPPGAPTHGSDATPDVPTPERAHGAISHGEIPHAEIRTHRPFHLIWLVPILAALLAGYLGYRAIANRGPTITITFRTGDGLVAGQTRVKHKAVDLGTVRSIDLSPDMSRVLVRVEMRRAAARVLTDNARFWVVRARLDAANVSGLDTLISGSYIELDPGALTGAPQTEFVGLEDPPAVRSDEPGRAFVLHASRIGALGSGSPIFYHDINAGEVLGYDLAPDGSAVTVHVFVRAPFDKFVRSNTHFWDVSGLNVDLGGQGISVKVASIAALIAGGLAFDIPPGAQPGTLSPTDALFQLYPDQVTANSAGFRRRIRFVTYVDSSVRGLAVGAPVELYGIRIGNVTGVHLEFDPSGASSRVVVHLELQPERLLRPDQIDNADPLAVSQTLVDRGLRLQFQTTSFITGSLSVAMVFQPGLPHVTIRREGDEIVLPNIPGGFDGIIANLSTVTAALARLPLDSIGHNLDATLKAADDIAGGSELKQTLASLASALASIRELAHTADTDLTPALKRLPEIAQGLQAAVDKIGRLAGSVDGGYGAGSEFRRDLDRLLLQVSDTARSVRLLADYLDQHPEALIRGRTDRASER